MDRLPPDAQTEALRTRFFKYPQRPIPFVFAKRTVIAAPAMTVLFCVPVFWMAAMTAGNPGYGNSLTRRYDTLSYFIWVIAACRISSPWYLGFSQSVAASPGKITGIRSWIKAMLSAALRVSTVNTGFPASIR